MLILVLHQNSHIRCISIIGKIWGKHLALLREATFMKAQLTTTGHWGRQGTQVKRPMWDEVLSNFERRMRMLQSLQGNKCCAIRPQGPPRQVQTHGQHVSTSTCLQRHPLHRCYDSNSFSFYVSLRIDALLLSWNGTLETHHFYISPLSRVQSIATEFYFFSVRNHSMWPGGFPNAKSQGFEGLARELNVHTNHHVSLKWPAVGK